MTCDAQILAQERRGVLAVPLQSVVLRAPDGQREQTGVFTIRDGVARFTAVKPGIIGGLEMEIEGVDDGASIVSGPFQVLRTLQDGDRVRPNPPGQ
jgi:hypothetical protein